MAPPVSNKADFLKQDAYPTISTNPSTTAATCVIRRSKINAAESGTANAENQLVLSADS